VVLEEAVAWLDGDGHREQGEFVLILHAAPVLAAATDDEDALATSGTWNRDTLLDALLSRLSVRDAARVAADITGLSRDALYRQALSRKAAGEADAEEQD
jgi:16S rRNA (cytidine1402-2'-O)-methyltransferase